MTSMTKGPPVYVRISNFEVVRTEEVVRNLVFVDYNSADGAVGVEVTSGAVERSLADDPQAVANILSNELMMLMNHMPRMGGPNLNEQKWGQALAQKLVDEGVLRAAEGGTGI